MAIPKQCRRFKSDFWNRLHERYIRHRKSRREFLDRTRGFFKRGRSHITLMFVPHSMGKVYKIQVSHFVLVFIGLILMTVLGFALAYSGKHRYSHSELTRLETLTRAREGQLQVFRNRARFTVRNYSRLVTQLKSLTQNLGLSDKHKATLMAAVPNALPAELVKDLDSGIRSLHELQDLDQLNSQLATSANQLRRINLMLEDMKKVMQHIPSRWPVKGGGFITMGYGYHPNPFSGLPRFHTGVDIAWAPGVSIKATAAGRVQYSKVDGGFGLCVKIRHKYGFYTRYAHLEDTKVTDGEWVRKGETIGTMGNSGRATGYHLHYEVLLNGQVINPEPYLTRKF